MTEKKEETRVLNTKIIEDIQRRENLGEKLKNHEKIWFNNMKGVRKANIPFALTNKEVEEYMKSKMSVHYFAEHFCQIKREDGTIGPMTLRDYQKDIIDLYTQNRFSILMASRQTGKCSAFNTKILALNEETKELYEIPFFELYYDIIKNERRLSLFEIIKLNLYRLHNLIES